MWFIWLAFGGTVLVGIELYEGIELPDVCYPIQPQSSRLGSRCGGSVNEEGLEVAHGRQPMDCLREPKE